LRHFGCFDDAAESLGDPAKRTRDRNCCVQEDYLKSGKDQQFVNTAKLVLTVINEHLALLNDLRSEHLTAL
jgi:hypothetical protein